jgi:quinol monooxygenase YgiN
MYGTVARFRALPGKREEMLRGLKEYDSLSIDGWVVDYAFQMDGDPDEFFMVAVFKDKAAYMANADAPAQHERYLKWRALLAADPEWHDGEVVATTGGATA